MDAGDEGVCRIGLEGVGAPGVGTDGDETGDRGVRQGVETDFNAIGGCCLWDTQVDDETACSLGAEVDGTVAGIVSSIEVGDVGGGLDALLCAMGLGLEPEIRDVWVLGAGGGSGGWGW